MPFIRETTGINEDIQVWEDIPVDNTVEASSAFVELFKIDPSLNLAQKQAEEL